MPNSVQLPTIASPLLAPLSFLPDVEMDGGRTQVVGACAEALRHAFATDFAIVDVTAAEVVQRPEGQPPIAWESFSELGQAVLRRGRPEFIADESPLLVLAVPLPNGPHQPLVGLGAFLTQPRVVGDALAYAAQQLGIDVDAAAAWAQIQPVADPETTLRLAELLVARMRAEVQLDNTQSELEQITTHLLATYEEISLLHRVTQNLKLSSTDRALCEAALCWLAEVLPVEGMAIKLKPAADADNVGLESRSKPLVLKHGDCPIEEAEFDNFIIQLGREALNEPIVLNRSVTGKASWPYPQVREVISVPLDEGDNVFGWVVAINHRHGGEFGTVEASLLGSVAAILGIHSGNIDLYRKQEEFLAGVVRALTSAIDAKDPYTCGHSDRVARVSVRLAQELGLSGVALNTLYLSGLLHDIGKIGIDDNVLRKPGQLTAAEYEHIKLHPELGYKILRDLKQLDQVLPVVLHHHEAWNGGGYPHGLAGEEIPLLARIVAVADSFDAMSSDRPYRKGMPFSRLSEILRGGAGTQWDPQVVDAFFAAESDILQIANSERANINFDTAQWC